MYAQPGMPNALHPRVGMLLLWVLSIALFLRMQSPLQPSSVLLHVADAVLLYKPHAALPLQHAAFYAAP